MLMTININYRFQSNETFDLKFKVKDGIKFQEYLNNPDTEKIVLKSNEVDVSGSDLLKDLLKKSDQIEFNLKYPIIDVDVFLLIEDNDRLFSDTVHLDGKLSYHKTHFKIDSTQNDSPLKIQTVLNVNERKEPNFNFNFDFTKWINKPIQFLPYLEKLNDFFLKLKDGKKLAVKVEFLGNNVLDAVLKMKNNTEFLDFANNYFLLCKKLKVVDSYFISNLLFPGFPEFKRDEIYDVEMLYDLITANEHIEKNKILTIRVEAKNNKQLYYRFVKGADIRLISDLTLDILGKKVHIEKITLDIVNPKFLISADEMKELVNSNK